MSYIPEQNLDKTAFNEVAVAERTPVIQVYGQNGLRDDVLVTEVGSGSVSNAESMFVCSTGTTAGSVAAALTKKQCTYRAGQGMIGLCTAIYTDPVANSLQLAGFINSEDFAAVGYNGTEFGFQFGQWGALEYQELTITVAAAGAENATVTVDGVGYTVPLTAGTQAQNAYEIAVSLNAQVPNYNFSSNASVVSALSTAPVPGGVFAFTSATATASWSQVVAGALPTVTTYPIDAEVVDWILDTTKGNVFMLRLKYLGFGSAKAYIEHPDTSELLWSATVTYPNRNTRPLWGNPTFRLGWGVQSLGSTTDLVIKGASAGGFIEGKIIRDERPRTESGSVTGLTSGTQHNVVSLRNRLHFNNRANRVEAYSISLIINTTSTKTSFVHIDIDPTYSGGYLDFSYVDQTSSCMEIASDTVVVSGGREVLTRPVLSVDGTVEIELGRYFSALYPSEILNVSVEVASGAAYDVDWSIVWQEDP